MKQLFAFVFAGLGLYFLISFIWIYAEKKITGDVNPNIIHTIIVALISGVVGYLLVK